MSEDSANIALVISRYAARDQFRNAVRLYVGKGRRYSVKQFSAGTGVPDRIVESFVAPTESAEFRSPNIEQLLSICSFLGPEFTCELLALAKQGAFWLPEADDMPPGVIVADSAEDMARVARMAVGGSFTCKEKPELQLVGTRMMVRGAHLREMGKAA